MASDLSDLKRLKITPETKAWLESERRKHPNRSMQDIARDALHEIAVAEIRAAKVLAALAPAEGISGATGGRGR